jgi:hypothetical protein
LYFHLVADFSPRFPFSFFYRASRFREIAAGHFTSLNFFIALQSKVRNLSIQVFPTFVQICPLLNQKLAEGGKVTGLIRVALLIGSEIAVVYWAKVRVTEAKEVNRLDDRFEVGEVNFPSGQEGRRKLGKLRIW